MGVGTKLTGAPSSIATFSITSNPYQKCCVGVGLSLGVALFFFSADADMLPPLLFTPCGGEFSSLITKSGSAVRFFAAFLIPPCPVILHDGAFIRGI